MAHYQKYKNKIKTNNSFFLGKYTFPKKRFSYGISHVSAIIFQLCKMQPQNFTGVVKIKMMAVVQPVSTESSRGPDVAL